MTFRCQICPRLVSPSSLLAVHILPRKPLWQFPPLGGKVLQHLRRPMYGRRNVMGHPSPSVPQAPATSTFDHCPSRNPGTSMPASLGRLPAMAPART